MSEKEHRFFSFGPLKWFVILGLLIWIPLICGIVMKEDIGDTIPVMQAGVVELVCAAVGVLTILLFLLFFCFCFRGFARIIALLGIAGGLCSGLFWFTSNYRVEFSGDMWPTRVVKIVEQRDLAVRAEPLPADKKWNELADGQFPKFLGPSGDLRVDWVDLDPEATEDDFKVLWKQQLGEGWSGFCAVDGVLFTMEQNGPDELVTAREAATGNIIWVHKEKHRHADVAGGVGPRSTPTFHQGKLYTLGAVGTLNCLNPTDGKVIWSLELTKEFNIPVDVMNEGTEQRYDAEKSGVNWGRAASPLIVGDKVIVPVGRSNKDLQTTLAAFDKNTGKLIWKGGSRQISYGTPVLAKLDGVSQILLTAEEHVVGHDPETGKELWSFPRSGNSGGAANTSQPIVYKDHFVLMTKEYGLGGQLVEVVKESAEGSNDQNVENDSDDQPKTKEATWKTRSQWQNRRALLTKLTVPIIDGEHAYCISSGFFECTELGGGKRLWREGRYKHGQILKVNDFFLVMSEDGRLSLLEADPDGCDTLVQTQSLLSGRCWNTLCIHKDKLYARSENQAICVQLPVKKK